MGRKTMNLLYLLLQHIKQFYSIYRQGGGGIYTQFDIELQVIKFRVIFSNGTTIDTKISWKVKGYQK